MSCNIIPVNAQLRVRLLQRFKSFSFRASRTFPELSFSKQPTVSSEELRGHFGLKLSCLFPIVLLWTLDSFMSFKMDQGRHRPKIRISRYPSSRSGYRNIKSSETSELIILVTILHVHPEERVSWTSAIVRRAFLPL